MRGSGHSRGGEATGETWALMEGPRSCSVCGFAGARARMDPASCAPKDTLPALLHVSPQLEILKQVSVLSSGGSLNELLSHPRLCPSAAAGLPCTPAWPFRCPP